MQAKGVIKDSVPWAKSREYFYDLAKRRIGQDDFIAKLKAADSSLTTAACIDILKDICDADWEDNKAVGEFLESEAEKLSAKIADIKKASISAQIEALQSELSGM